MMRLLLKLFVKNYQNTADQKVRAAYGLLSGICGVGLNALLCVFKFAIGVLSGSAAIIADAANNLSDAAASGIGIVGFKLAAKPADEEHPFGHGRLEYVLSLVISFLVLLMGVELLKSAVEKMLHPVSVTDSPFVYAVLIVSIAVKLWMGYFNFSLSKRAQIGALKAVGVDSLSDASSTLAVLVSLLLNRFLSWNIDAYIGAAVALFVLWNGVGILKEALHPLIGKPADKKTVESLKQFILQYHPSVLGLHDLVLHDYGMGSIFAVAHIEVPAQSRLVAIHDMVDALEKEVEQRFGIHLVLHTDPVDLHDTRLAELQRQVQTVVKSVDEHYTIHDFRLSADKKQMLFDLVIDGDIPKRPETIEREVQLRITSALGEVPKPVINVEFPFEEQ